MPTGRIWKRSKLELHPLPPKKSECSSMICICRHYAMGYEASGSYLRHYEPWNGTHAEGEGNDVSLKECPS
jgi:hypothetical protein